MAEAASTDRAWFHTMALLSSETRVHVPSGRARLDYRPDAHHQCVIRVLERHGNTGATVAWSDPTSCCYGEQLWRRCVARKRGACALSGKDIAAGDAVYRPRRVGQMPCNSEAMILASVLEALPADDLDQLDHVYGGPA
jgi:Domain of unknown function (DUF3331)